jgi:hypothetical protein
VGIAVPADEQSEPDVQQAIHNAAELALDDTEVDNRGAVFDVRVQIQLSNPHIKEVRATITRSDTET